MHHRQILEDLLVFGKFCLFFLPLILILSPNMMHFVRT